LILDEEQRLMLAHRETGVTRAVGPIEGSGTVVREQLGLSRDGRTALVQAQSVEANIWLLSPPGAAADE
jgi:hypothetical protein